MTDISGFQSQVYIVASNTFPVGFNITQFSDDADAFDLPNLQIGDSAMGLNGDLITWSKANPLKLTLNVVPNGDDDNNLSILFDANRVGRGKVGAKDIITLTITYPDLRIISFTNGAIIEGIPGQAIQSSGRLKTKPYSFVFENKVGI